MKNWLIGLLLVVLAAAAYYYIAVYDPFAEETLPPPITTVAIEATETPAGTGPA